MADAVFVSFDYENDRHYKYLLEAWHAHPRFTFVFQDETPREIDSTNVGRIKAALTAKIKHARLHREEFDRAAQQLPKTSPRPAFTQWLGLRCDRDLVRASGVWNSKHVEERYDPAFLDRLDLLVAETGHAP